MKAQYARLIYSMAAVICFGSVAVAVFYFQDVLWLEPCPYCKLQRVIFIVLGIIFSILAIINPQRPLARFIAWCHVMFVVGIGLYIAGRHVYVQTYPSPESAASCQTTSDNLIEVLDFAVVRSILSAQGDCSQVSWSIFGITIPMLSLIAFIGLGLVACWILKRPAPKRFY